jgi:hypothetical protein
VYATAGLPFRVIGLFVVDVVAIPGVEEVTVVGMPCMLPISRY